MLFASSLVSTAMTMPWISISTLGLYYLLIYLTQVRGCNFGMDSDCHFRCKCDGGVSCDPVTGDCDGGKDCARGRPSGYDWGGRGCLTGNAAYDKPAAQNGVYRGWVANLAVDGNPNTDQNEGSCAHPDAGSGGKAWWQVDLMDLYRITNVTIYNTNNDNGAYRLRNFYLEVSNSTGEPYVQCASRRDAVPPGSHETISCESVGRTLRLRSQNKRFLTPCEVIVTGNQYIDCTGCSTNCNDIYGCVDDCQAGKDQSTLCAKDCQTSYYGVNCQSRCGNCNSAPCDIISGSCADGCQDWWVTAKCDVFLNEVNFQSVSPSIADITGTSVLVTWPSLREAAPIGFRDNYGYVLELQESNVNTWVPFYNMTFGKESGDNQVSYKANALRPNVEYEVRVLPYRHDGRREEFGTTTNVESFKTSCIAPSSPLITNVSLTDPPSDRNSTIQTIWVVWQGSSTSGCNRITATKVIFGLAHLERRLWQSLQVNSQTEVTLMPDEAGLYHVVVMATNDQDLSSETDPYSIKVIDILHPEPDGTDVGLYVGVTIVILLVLAAVIVAAVMIIRRKRKHHSAPTRGKGPVGADKVYFAAENGHLALDPLHGEDDYANVTDPVEVMNAASADERRSITTLDESLDENLDLYENAGHVRESGVIKLGALETYIRANRDQEDGFRPQFLGIPKNSGAKAEVGRSFPKKNRYQNIVPYDHTRVVLHDSDNDYINASYIKGYPDKERGYIASQGPKPETMEDFWLMVWQENSNRIIMLSPEVENGKRQSEQYWPSETGASVEIGQFTISLLADENLANYTLRILTVKRQLETRTVRHLHFVTWPDKDRPLNDIDLFDLRHKVQSLAFDSSGPLIVHCSAGVGRTGTLIAFDFLMDQAVVEGAVNVQNAVRQLRYQRQHMVQTLSQYEFLYDSLLEYHMCGDTTRSCDQFLAVYRKWQKDPTSCKIPEVEFKSLERLRPGAPHRDASGLQEKNTWKNRDPNIIPDDSHRPYLIGGHGDRNDYINAVFVHTFHKIARFVVTQTPLVDTHEDLWRLVHHHNCTAIVILNDANPQDQASKYWPDESSSLQFGSLHVTREPSDKGEIDVSITDTKPLRVRETRSVRLFRLSQWPNQSGTLYNGLGSLLDLIATVQDWQQRRPEGPVIIQCMNGATRCGVFCAASHVIERMKLDREVDVYMAARYVTARRSHFLHCQEQYELLYHLAHHYLGQNDTYANFQ